MEFRKVKTGGKNEKFKSITVGPSSKNENITEMQIKTSDGLIVSHSRIDFFALVNYAKKHSMNLFIPPNTKIGNW